MTMDGDTVEYNKLGSTGLIVSELALGAMTFGGQAIDDLTINRDDVIVATKGSPTSPNYPPTN